jgi:hypothetical protein
MRCISLFQRRGFWCRKLASAMVGRYPNCAKVCPVGQTTHPLIHRRALVEDPDQFRAAVSGTTIEVDRLSKPVGPSHIEQVGSAAGWALDIGT